MPTGRLVLMLVEAIVGLDIEWSDGDGLTGGLFFRPPEVVVSLVPKPVGEMVLPLGKLVLGLFPI